MDIEEQESTIKTLVYFTLRKRRSYNAAAKSPAIPAIPAPNPSICPVGAAAPELAAAAVELVLDADVTEADVAVFVVELLARVAVADALLEHTAAEGRVTPTGWQIF
jgi:hypothetical protein